MIKGFLKEKKKTAKENGCMGMGGKPTASSAEDLLERHLHLDHPCSTRIGAKRENSFFMLHQHEDPASVPPLIPTLSTYQEYYPY